jgi:protease-4
MDEGIRARRLERLFRQLAHDRRVKAVVFRVDSPGGDPLASDLVASAVRACSQRKPVIVSQGQVAASGGYWLSMAADSVLAGPATLTGSIGVIGGWLYDQGASSKLGMTSDVVQHGRHADYMSGVRFPFLGMRLPRRPLSDTETARVDVVMADLYRRFVDGVAGFRHLSFDSVHALAEGRIYSGLDAHSAGLVDGIGGLLLAFDLAAAKAGLRPGDRPEIVEYPEHAGWFAWPWQPPAVADLLPEEAWEEALRLIAEFNGQPLTLLSPDSTPAED